MQLSQHQHQDSPLSSPGNVSLTLQRRNMDTSVGRCEDTACIPCQRQILDIQWWQHISNADVLQRSGLPLISDILLNRRQSLFGHIARLDSSVPANAALQLMVNSHEGKKPSTTWTRPSGRPRRTWLNHIQDADARPLSTIWRSEVARGHGGAQPTVRQDFAMMMMMMIFCNVVIVIEEFTSGGL